MGPISVYAYLDYRQFLKDLTRSLKASKQFNVREFARKAQIKAPGYLKMVVDGQRQLTEGMIHKFCRALAISGKEKVYFEKLVRYNQTRDPDLKAAYLEDILALQPRSSNFVLSKKQNRYFSRPHYVCIREMVALSDFREDPKWIAKRCLPRIRSAEVKEAIDTLLELGLLKRSQGGKLRQTEDFISTQDFNTQVIETYHFHEAMLNKARHALGNLSQAERNYYALTLPMTKKLYDEAIQEFYAFRDRIAQKVNDEQAGYDEVYQINFQLFPVTKKRGDEG